MAVKKPCVLFLNQGTHCSLGVEQGPHNSILNLLVATLDVAGVLGAKNYSRIAFFNSNFARFEVFGF